MRWWARISSGDSYGDWKPTPCRDKNDAIDYANTRVDRWHVKEWLLM